MRDEDVKPILDLATAEPPPLGIDIGGIAERGRRVRRRRAILAAAGSSATVVGITVLTLVTLGAPRHGPAVEPATQLPTGPTTSTSPTATCHLQGGGPCPGR